jgi:hypothetical protein
VLLIDHQIGLMAGVRDVSSLAEYKSNVVGLARVAKAATTRMFQEVNQFNNWNSTFHKSVWLTARHHLSSQRSAVMLLDATE